MRGLSGSRRHEDALDRFLKGFMRNATVEEREAAARVRLEIREDEHGYTIFAELPGVDRGDIDVRIDGNLLTIAADVKRELERRDEDVLHTERYYGKSLRSFLLPQNVVPGEARATFVNGVLRLTLPKEEADASQKLRID